MVKLKVVAPGTNPLSTKVYMDDKEITGIRRLDVSLYAGEIGTATIEFFPSEIEIEGDFLAVANINGNHFDIKLRED